MSVADEAWQEWANEKERRFSFEHRERAAFMAGYRRALEDAADEVAEMWPSMPLGDGTMSGPSFLETQLRAAAVAPAPRETKD